MDELNLAPFVKELFAMDEMHEEYKDDEIHFSIDSQKKGDSTLVITIKLKEDNVKEQFEKWVDDLDDEIFEEAVGIVNEHFNGKMNEVYTSENYKDVINLFKATVTKLAQEKINSLRTKFGL